MRIVLFRQRGVIPGLIRLQQRGAVDHAGILFSDGCFIEATWPRVRKVQWPDVTIPMSTRVEIYRITCSLKVEAQIEQMVRPFAEEQIGKRYDLSSVIRFVTRRQAARKAAGKWFCSELVFAALREGGAPLFERTEPWEVSPAMLRRSTLLTPAMEVIK